VLLLALLSGGCGLVLGIGDFTDGEASSGTAGQGGTGGQVLGEITVEPGDSKMGVLRALTFTASVAVDWSVQEENGGTVDANGRYLSPAEPGVYHVIATAQDNASNTKTVEVTVVPLGITLAGGIIGGFGNIDGPPARAHFSGIRGLGYLSGTLIMADTGNDTVRKLEGNTVTTVAGMPGMPGTADGVGPDARFDRPTDIAVDENGDRVWVVDQQNACIRRVDVATGAVTTFAGTCGTAGYTDGNTGAETLLGNIDSMVLGPRREAIYTCEIEFPGCPNAQQFPPEQGACFRGIRRIDVMTGKTTTVVYGLNNSCQLATDMYNGNSIYFNDNNNDIAIRTLIDVPGGPATPVNGDTLPNLIAPMPYSSTQGIATVTGVGGWHDVFTLGFEPVIYDYLIGDPMFSATPFAGAVGDRRYVDGPLAEARFAGFGGFISNPSSGRLFLADTGAAVVREIDLSSEMVSTPVGSPKNLEGVNGPVAVARLTGPAAVALDDDGSLFVAELGGEVPSNTIRKIDGATRAISAFAGVPLDNPVTNPPQDGPKDMARFGLPADLVRAGGDLFVIDLFGHAVRRVSIATGDVSTIAGELGVAGYSEGAGAAAHFAFSAADSFFGGGITTDDGTNLYVADTGNFAVRKIVIATGEVSTLAGGTEGTLNGAGTAAQFLAPTGLAYVDGILYVADSTDSVIRRIDVATAEVTTLIGLSGVTGQVDGDASAATFLYPARLVSDGIGNLYVSEYLGSVIRRIDIAGKRVSTLAGVRGQLGLAPATLPSTVNCPFGFVVDPKGDLIFADYCDGAVAAIRPL
jgi:streptogramin lyase